ncbi:MAG TPA: hypothetical protein VNF71_04510 [Acidimicrobiales bacterium]|nr:hypothetical protein [Acidimicrobiales bacterium]
MADVVDDMTTGDEGDVETDADRGKAWWFYLGYATIAAALGVGAYLTAGTVRVVLIILAALFAGITIWSVLFMTVIEYVAHVGKQALGRD